MTIILAHIYIGSVGMEGAYDAMGSGEVEEQWAREHHSLWVEEMMPEKSINAVLATSVKSAPVTVAPAVAAPKKVGPKKTVPKKVAPKKTAPPAK